jgi:hypothetical protein
MPTPTEPGPYVYIDPIGSPPERVDVVLDGEVLAVCFQCAEAGQELVPVADVAGDFEPA